MTKRRRLTKVAIALASVALLCYAGWHAFRAVTAYTFLLAFSEMADEEPLFDFEHRSVETIGRFTDSDAESNYNFVANGTGISFPDGTVMDQYDDSWGQIACCFQLPPDVLLPDLLSSRFQKSGDTNREPVAFPDLTEPNRNVPPFAKKYETTSFVNSYPITLYADLESNRVWVDHRYPSPMD